MECFLSPPCTQEALLSSSGRLVIFTGLLAVVCNTVNFAHLPSLSFKIVDAQKDGPNCPGGDDEQCYQFRSLWQDARDFHKNGQWKQREYSSIKHMHY